MNKLKTDLINGYCHFSFAVAEAQTTSKKSSTKKEKPAVQFQCPMKCEGEKTYDKNGSCPVCNMQLNAIKVAAIPAASYRCPMKCEAEKTYAKAGKCPVCNMELKDLQVRKLGDAPAGASVSMDHLMSLSSARIASGKVN